MVARVCFFFRKIVEVETKSLMIFNKAFHEFTLKNKASI